MKLIFYSIDIFFLPKVLNKILETCVNGIIWVEMLIYQYQLLIKVHLVVNNLVSSCNNTSKQEKHASNKECSFTYIQGKEWERYANSGWQ